MARISGFETGDIPSAAGVVEPNRVTWSKLSGHLRGSQALECRPSGATARARDMGAVPEGRITAYLRSAFRDN
jgi:hypothetical protein